MARPTPDRDRVLDEAFVVLADAGLSGVTARAVATRLGVAAGVLYYHGWDMPGIVDAMATRVLRQAAEATAALPEDLSWQDLLRRTASATRQVLLGTRDGGRLVTGRSTPDPTVVTRGERLLRALTDAGFALDDAVRAGSVVTDLVLAAVTEEQERAEHPDAYVPDARAARVDPSVAPLTHASSATVMGDRAAYVEWAVDTVVAGLEARLASARLASA